MTKWSRGGAATEFSHQSVSSPSGYCPSDEFVASKEASQGSRVPLPSTPALPCAEMDVPTYPEYPRIDDFLHHDSGPQVRAWYVACAQQVRKLGSSRKPARRAITALAVCTASLFSALILPVIGNFYCSFVSGCAPALVWHLQSVGLRQYAGAMCSRGYNRLQDVLHLSRLQCASIPHCSRLFCMTWEQHEAVDPPAVLLHSLGAPRAVVLHLLPCPRNSWSSVNFACLVFYDGL
jgi:hypothetical protein